MKYVAETMEKPQKRSLTISGHRTSISLEAEFWDSLASFAKARNQTLAKLVAEIDQSRGNRNLSSAIRVWVLHEAMKL